VIFPCVGEKVDPQEQRRRAVEGSARRVLAAFDKERDRLTFDQWAALEALEEALYGGQE